MQNNEIILGQGLGEIKFGLTMDEVEAIMGKPEEVEESEEDEEFEYEVWNYWEEGYSFYFDEDDDYRLGLIETANEEVTMFGKKIFQMKQAEVEELLKANGLSDQEKDTLETGEKHITYEKEMLDMYFEKDVLITIKFGVFVDDDLEVKWPTL
jgi:flavin-dependent dehydrogenase